jgi:hypothetical protein
MVLGKGAIAEMEADERERSLRAVAARAMERTAVVEARLSTALGYLEYWKALIRDPTTRKMANRVERILRGEFS